MTTKLNILVFDDSAAHRTAAEVTLKDHNLTVVGTYDEAQAALLPVTDFDAIDAKMKELFGDFNPWRATEEEANKKAAYQLAKNQATKDFTIVPNFDVVLTDLMVPPSGQAQANKVKYAKEEMPLGTIIALLAIKVGVKRVAVVTDTDHHQHPASAAFDCFRGVGGDEVKVLCTSTNRIGLVNVDKQILEVIDEKYLTTPEGKEKYPGNW